MGFRLVVCGLDNPAIQLLPVGFRARRAMPLQIRVQEAVGAWPCRAPNLTADFDTGLISAAQD